MTFLELIDIYYKKFHNSKSSAPLLSHEKGRVIKNFEPFLEKDIKELSSNDIDDFFKNFTGSQEYKKTLMGYLKKILKAAYANGLIEDDLASAIKIERNTDKKYTQISDENLVLIEGYLKSERVRYVYKFALMTGLNVSEIRCLKWEDIDFDKKIIVVKNKMNFGFKETELIKPAHYKVIEIDEEVIDLLKEVREINTYNNYVFEDLDGNYYKHQYLLELNGELSSITGINNFGFNTIKSHLKAIKDKKDES